MLAYEGKVLIFQQQPVTPVGSLYFPPSSLGPTLACLIACVFVVTICVCVCYLGLLLGIAALKTATGLNTSSLSCTSAALYSTTCNITLAWPLEFLGLAMYFSVAVLHLLLLWCFASTWSAQVLLLVGPVCSAFFCSVVLYKKIPTAALLGLPLVLVGASLVVHQDARMSYAAHFSATVASAAASLAAATAHKLLAKDNSCKASPLASMLYASKHPLLPHVHSSSSLFTRAPHSLAPSLSYPNLSQCETISCALSITSPPPARVGQEPHLIHSTRETRQRSTYWADPIIHLARRLPKLKTGRRRRKPNGDTDSESEADFHVALLDVMPGAGAASGGTKSKEAVCFNQCPVATAANARMARICVLLLAVNVVALIAMLAPIFVALVAVHGSYLEPTFVWAVTQLRRMLTFGAAACISLMASLHLIDSVGSLSLGVVQTIGILLLIMLSGMALPFSTPASSLTVLGSFLAYVPPPAGNSCLWRAEVSLPLNLNATCWAGLGLAAVGVIWFYGGMLLGSGHWWKPQNLAVVLQGLPVTEQSTVVASMCQARGLTIVGVVIMMVVAANLAPPPDCVVTGQGF